MGLGPKRQGAAAPDRFFPTRTQLSTETDANGDRYAEVGRRRVRDS